MFITAIARKPGKNFAQGITTADAGLGKPDYTLLQAQHDAYLETLRQVGIITRVLDELPEYPDAYFVEDVAV